MILRILSFFRRLRLRQVLDVAELVGFVLLGLAAWITWGVGAGFAVFGAELVAIGNLPGRRR